jgi:hypothetical protein
MNAFDYMQTRNHLKASNVCINIFKMFFSNCKRKRKFMDHPVCALPLVTVGPASLS